MKRLFIILSTIIFAVMTAWAQENPKLSYQAVVRDNQNKLLANSQVNVEIHILKPDLTLQYSEIFSNVSTNQNGLMSLLIGNNAEWDNVAWFKAKINVKITLPAGMGIVESTSDVSAVPLAIHTLYADSVNLDVIPQSDWNETNPTKCAFIKNKPSISDSIRIRLSDGSSVVNHIIDTIVDDHILKSTDTLISYRELTDTVNVLRKLINNTIEVDISALEYKVNIFHEHICDSVRDCVLTWISDSLETGISPLVSGKADTASSLAGYGITDARIDGRTITLGGNAITVATANDLSGVCDSVRANIMDTLKHYLTDNSYVTTSALENHHYLTSDSAVITMMQDGISNNSHDIALVIGKIETDSINLAARINSLKDSAMNCDDVKTCINEKLSQYTTTNQLCNVISTCDLSSNISLKNLLKDLSIIIEQHALQIKALQQLVDTVYKSSPTLDSIRSTICGYLKVKDVDNNEYKTVQLGTQCWMAENLRATKYADGSNIPLGTSLSSVSSIRYYPNGDSSNVTIYGYLYNWKAVMRNYPSSDNNPSGVQGICPNGWHVPSDQEWTKLYFYLNGNEEYLCNGYNSYFGKAMASTSGWNSSTDDCTVGNNLSSNNASGFSVFPSGDYHGEYSDFGNSAYFWCSTESPNGRIFYRLLKHNQTYLLRYNISKDNAYSVRCVKD